MPDPEAARRLMTREGTRMTVDLLVRAGRVFCAATGRDGPGSVAIRDGRIVEAGDRPAAREVLEFPDALLIPGLVDLHAHPARGGSKYGICPDRYMLPTGVTTVLSQGDAGAGTWPAYRDDVVRACRTRVRLALNLSARGEATALACYGDPADVDVEACVATLAEGDDALWGISVNLSRFSCGTTDPRWVFARALEAAGRSGKPLLFGAREAVDWPLAEQLAMLRPGDVVTYCYMASREPGGARGARARRDFRRGARHGGLRRRDGAHRDRRGLSAGHRLQRSLRRPSGAASPPRPAGRDLAARRRGPSRARRLRRGDIPPGRAARPRRRGRDARAGRVRRSCGSAPGRGRLGGGPHDPRRPTGLTTRPHRPRGMFDRASVEPIV
jgi:hypothetical protein